MTTPFPFVAAQILTASELNSITNLPSSTKTTSYVLTLTNAGARVVMNAAGSTTITANTSIFSAGDIVELSNIGAGTCTVTAGTATVSSAGPLAIPQYGGGRLVFTSASAAIYFPSAVTVAAPAAAGLTLIQAVTTSAATVTASNCFSGTYKNYLIVADGIVGCTNGFALEIRFGVSGTPTTTGYKTSSFSAAPTTTGYISYNSADPDPSAFAMNIFAPNVAAKTVYNFSGYSMYEERQVLLGGNQTSANQFTDFVLTAGGGAFTSGTMRVYGYSNS